MAATRQALDLTDDETTTLDLVAWVGEAFEAHSDEALMMNPDIRDDHRAETRERLKRVLAALEELAAARGRRHTRKKTP